MDAIDSLIAGYKAFRAGTYRQNEERYQALAAKRQQPKAMIIACCDSRADPAMVFSADPGELFVVRNVANLVPPYQPDSHYHGTSAALEFGVKVLEIADLIVMGHAGCGGIEALYDAGCGHPPEGEFISNWMSLATGVETSVRHKHGELEKPRLLRMMEQGAVVQSLEMLRTFPFVAEREAAGKLRLHGWFYGIGTGILSIYDPAKDQFAPVGE
ncbi:carbonic anhydrase [Parvibaculum sp.]|uniref:carbonic anhydrase n=1 Tax=Parvibaculum sp. TaxID=2024848 RepID=UPI00272F0C59|nr:carbonic anhydrase [Parvibaculum sp.]MDP1628085.1 carbonic anhydrase [Parvibaculum sp.]MDP2151084.1 carbonic anhydrase [Parvibaculum sp.]MDP3328551.1 carbonic anhydrase [Parvibaculum sp.]